MRTFEVYGPEYSEIRQGQNIMHALLASSIPASQIVMIEDVQVREAEARVCDKEIVP